MATMMESAIPKFAVRLMSAASRDKGLVNSMILVCEI